MRVPVKAGRRTIGVAFVEKATRSADALRPYQSTLDPVDQGAAVGHGDGQRSVRGHRPRRHRQPSAYLQLPSTVRRRRHPATRRDGVRETDCRCWRDAPTVVR